MGGRATTAFVDCKPIIRQVIKGTGCLFAVGLRATGWQLLLPRWLRWAFLSKEMWKLNNPADPTSLKCWLRSSYLAVTRNSAFGLGGMPLQGFGGSLPCDLLCYCIPTLGGNVHKLEGDRLGSKRSLRSRTAHPRYKRGHYWELCTYATTRDTVYVHCSECGAVLMRCFDNHLPRLLHKRFVATTQNIYWPNGQWETIVSLMCLESA